MNTCLAKNKKKINNNYLINQNEYLSKKRSVGEKGGGVN